MRIIDSPTLQSTFSSFTMSRAADSLYAPRVRSSSTPMFATPETWFGRSQRQDIQEMIEFEKRWAGFSPSNYPIPRAEWKEAAAKASEFVLRHKVYKSDRDDSIVLFDFLKIHYPTHYCYDFLHGLRILAELGVPRDERMDDALRLLRAKQLVDGRWPLEGVYRGWRHSHPMHGTETVSRPEERELVTEGWGTDKTLQLEEAGKPSKWVTLQALLVLKRLGLLEAQS